VAPTPAELAEAPARYYVPRPGVELIDRGDLLLEVGRRGEVHLPRLADVPEAVAWVRNEARTRQLEAVRWWVGWSAQPRDLVDRLLAEGLAWTEMPSLLGLTSQTAPPPEPEVEVRELLTVDELLEAIAVDWTVWSVPEDDWEKQRERERERFAANASVTHFGAYLDGKPVGFGRAIDMHQAVALMGGTVLPEARGRGIYRALVRARWDHAVDRGTPLLVVQAGPMSAPILEGLGFVSHGELRQLNDPGVAS
jgi:GNAT superfamily N-acetyltransferase